MPTENHRAPYSGNPPTSFNPAPGALVVLRNWKWDGLPHWVLPCQYVDSDDFGHWLLLEAGQFISRPGYAIFPDKLSLILIPYEEQWAATFHTDGQEFGLRVYVDLVTDIRWTALGHGHGWEVNLVDMDLDVLGYDDGRTVLDDEDEFAENQKIFGYPDDMIADIEAEAYRIYEMVAAGEEPFDGRDIQMLKRARELAPQVSE